jgi:hypothetical protein
VVDEKLRDITRQPAGPHHVAAAAAILIAAASVGRYRAINPAIEVRIARIGATSNGKAQRKEQRTSGEKPRSATEASVLHHDELSF